MFNDPRALRDHNEKLRDHRVRRSYMRADAGDARSMDVLRGFHRDHGDIVVKPLDGMGGTGVFRLKADDPNLNVDPRDDHRAAATRTVMAQTLHPRRSATATSACC